MSCSCAEWRGDIGAYVVGALDGPARGRVSRHLAACPGCRADYDDLVPVRAWLGRLAAAGEWPKPGRAEGRGRPPHSLPASPFSADRSDEAQGRATRRRPRRLLAAVAAAAAAFLAALAISLPSARSFRAVDSATGVSGRAQLHGTPAGTQIDLTATGLPGGKRCILVAVAPGGAEIAGTWDTTYDGSARITGTSAFPARQLTAVRIESGTGVVLLSIRVWP
jgi:hypothetical protein